MAKLIESHKLYEQASQLIPWATQTNAKKYHPEIRQFAPAFIERGKGCRVWDVDGNEYIDFKCALGPIVLGYADNEVNNAVKCQLDQGTVYNTAHPLEVQLARLVNQYVPCAERVRFLKTGGDANSAAVRIARACTGRERILSVGYHGWLDTVNACMNTVCFPVRLTGLSTTPILNGKWSRR